MSPPLSDRTLARLEELLRDFPNRQSALIPSLYVVQEEENHLTEENLQALARVLRMPASRIYETATFYSLFTFAPRGRHVIRLCRSICCWLRGGDALLAAIQEKLAIGPDETTGDGRFTLRTAECLAACDRAPALQIDDVVYGPVGAGDLDGILEEHP